jgi:hypothetical protein
MRRLVIAVIVTVTLAGTAVLVWYGTRGAEVATDLAVALAVFSLVASVAFTTESRRRATVETSDTVVVDLARKVLQHEQVALAAALGEIGEPKPANVDFRRPRLVNWRADGSPEHGSSRDIADFYLKLDRGRLVVVGEPGAGKSVLATCLCIDLAKKAITEPGATAIIPIKLSLLACNPDGYPHDQPPGIAAVLLDRWIRQSVAQRLDVHPQLASALVDQGRILPVLDGLDEMDASSHNLVRAVELAGALNYHSSGRLPRFVLTSRKDCFEELANPIAEKEPSPIQDATVVELERLRMDDIIDYLSYCFFDPESAARIQSRWLPVVRTLKSGKPTALQQALTVPLFLFLLVSAYRRVSSDPEELLVLKTAEQVHDRLYQLLIATGVAKNKRSVGHYRHLTAELATTWLRNLAESMAQRVDVTESMVDIEIHRISRISNSKLPRCIAALVVAATTVPLVALAWSRVGAVATIPTLMLALMSIILQVTGTTLRISRISFRAFLIQARRPVNVVLLLATGVSICAMNSGIHRLTGIGAATYLLGMIFVVSGSALYATFRPSDLGRHDGLMSSLFQRIGAESSRSLVRSGIAATAINLCVIGALFLPFITAFRPPVLLVGVALTTCAALNLGLSPWLTYALSSAAFAMGGRFAGRPALFLDWAQDAGLVGIYGDVFRFRHREFQAWLLKEELELDLPVYVIAQRLF